MTFLEVAGMAFCTLAGGGFFALLADVAMTAYGARSDIRKLNHKRDTEQSGYWECRQRLDALEKRFPKEDP